MPFRLVLQLAVLLRMTSYSAVFHYFHPPLNVDARNAVFASFEQKLMVATIEFGNRGL